jgi:hypothetical protein
MGIYGVEFDFLFVRRLAEDSADDGDQQKCDDALLLVDTFAYYVLKEFLADYKKIMKTPGVAEQGGPNGRLCAKSELLFPAINVNDYSIKSSPGDVYGCCRFLLKGILRATDVMIGEKPVDFIDAARRCLRAADEAARGWSTMGFEVSRTSPDVLKKVGGMDDYLPDPVGTTNLEFKCPYELLEDFLALEKKDELLFPANDVNDYVTKSTPDHVYGCCALPDDIARAKDVKIEGKLYGRSPDIMEKMGATDTLYQIANLTINLVDTFTYYKTEKFLSGYKKISRRLLAARPAAPLGRFSGGGLAPAAARRLAARRSRAPAWARAPSLGPVSPAMMEKLGATDVLCQFICHVMALPMKRAVAMTAMTPDKGRQAGGGGLKATIPPDKGRQASEGGLEPTIPLDKTKYSRMAMVYKGVSEKTTLDVLALRKLAAKDALLFPANNVSDCMRKPELNNVYGCRYPLVNDKRGLVNDKRRRGAASRP